MNIEDQLERFREEKFSHLSAEEHLASVNDSIEKYRQIHLSIELFDRREGSLHDAELELTREAIGKGCKYVTNLDYSSDDSSIRIIARGLIKK